MIVDNLICKISSSRLDLGKSAAKDVILYLKEKLQSKKYLRLIFAAAPSQNEFLQDLSEATLDWDRITVFHMDEYIGLSKEAPQSFANFLKNKIFSKLPFKKVNYIEPYARTISEECERYSKLLLEDSIDAVFMGVGENGHIAFNDPPLADFYDKKMVKQVELDQLCRQQQVNDKCFSSLDEVPTHAITLTIPMLMSAQALFCMVPGATKNKAILSMLQNPISPACPASIIRRHINAKLYLDKESSKGLLLTH